VETDVGKLATACGFEDWPGEPKELALAEGIVGRIATLFPWTDSEPVLDENGNAVIEDGRTKTRQHRLIIGFYNDRKLVIQNTMKQVECTLRTHTVLQQTPLWIPGTSVNG
jgi:hypothetical protein